VQRESYPHRGAGSRLEAYPALSRKERPYSRRWERASWSWEAVLSHLSGVMVPRRVDRCGKIGLYHAKVYVGTVNRGKEVVVGLDAATSEWVISDRGGVSLCRRPLRELDAAGLRRLPVA